MKRDPAVVLHIEDDAAHAMIVRRILADISPETRVMHVSDGQAALDYLFRDGKYTDIQTSPRPLVILLDLRLPRMDGLEVLKCIKSDNDLYCIPVVVLTTSDARQDISSAYRDRVNGYLTKASDHARLVKQLEAFSTFWLDWNNCVS